MKLSIELKKKLRSTIDGSLSIIFDEKTDNAAVTYNIGYANGIVDAMQIIREHKEEGN